MRNLPKKSRLRLINQTVFGVRAKGIFECTCGVIKELEIASVTSGNTRSCGCLKRELDGIRTKTHGLSKHPLYETWKSMIDRCHNPNSYQYKYYGLLGIFVCDEWRKSPKLFIDWAVSNGWQKGKKIDKDIKGGNCYSPINCLIVTHKVNSNFRTTNHLLTYNGETKNIQQWAELFKISHRAIRSRISRGWNVIDIFETPVNTKRYGERK